MDFFNTYNESTANLLSCRICSSFLLVSDLADKDHDRLATIHKKCTTEKLDGCYLMVDMYSTHRMMF